MARLFVDNLTVMDFSYLDVDRGVVGESWIVDIELGGELDDQGMVFDFGHVKKQIKQLIDAQADHRLLVPAAYAGCRTQSVGNDLLVEFSLANGGLIRHQSPRDAVLLVTSDVISAEVVAEDLALQLRSVLPDNVSDVLVKLRCEEIEGAFFHYSHGLQKHQGQCQRIAHGHRSRLELSVHGARDRELEAQWVAKLRDIYIASEEHISGKTVHNGMAHIDMAYDAAQGHFSLSVPEHQVFVVPCVSTVENIANHLALAASTDCGLAVQVKAFEGVGKGAFGSAETV